MAGRKVQASQRFRPEQIDTALLELAVCQGQTAHAARALADRGLKINRTTLQRWRDETHVERYQEVRARIAPMVEAEVVEGFRLNLRKGVKVADELLDLLRQKVAAGEIDPGKAFQQVQIGNGIGAEKMLLLEGRPTEILETRDTQTLLQDLKQIAPGLVVDGTAIEVTPQELPAHAGKA